MDILELSERLDLQRFHSHTLRLYRAVCALGNNRVAHALCSHVDQAQLLHALEDAHLPGPLRAGYYDLLISIHLESACRSRRSMLSEYVVPLTEETRAITLFPPGKSAENGPRRHGLPGVGVSTSLRPPHHFSPPCFVAALPAAGAAEAPARLSPSIPLEALRDKALRMLGEAVRDGGQHARDPVGGSVEFQFVPVLKLVSTLLVMVSSCFPLSHSSSTFQADHPSIHQHPSHLYTQQPVHLSILHLSVYPAIIYSPFIHFSSHPFICHLVICVSVFSPFFPFIPPVSHHSPIYQSIYPPPTFPFLHLFSQTYPHLPIHKTIHLFYSLPTCPSIHSCTSYPIFFF